MLSLSDNEFSVLGFLARNFSERLTIRNIAKRLDFSPAGVFNILKKLEKNEIVIGEKLGSGLFYSINFENKIAWHLAAVALLSSDEKFREISEEQIRQAKAAVFDGKNLLLVTDSISSLEISIPEINVITKAQDELIESFRKKDSQALLILKKGMVLFGEDIIVDTIKKCIFRF